MVSRSLLLITALWLLSAPQLGMAQNLGPSEPLIRIQTPSGGAILAELADTPEKRARGLMFRQSLSPERGMLFTFPEAQRWTIWMKNTKIPLDILWLDAATKIVHIERHVPVCTRADDGCPQYQPLVPASYVLELGAGVADALHLKPGTTLRFQPPAP